MMELLFLLQELVAETAAAHPSVVATGAAAGGSVAIVLAAFKTIESVAARNHASDDRGVQAEIRSEMRDINRALATHTELLRELVDVQRNQRGF